MPVPPHVRIGDAPDILRTIADPEVNLVIWTRAPSCAGRGGVALDAVDDVAFDGAVDRLGTDLPAELGTAGYPGAVARAIGADIAMLAHEFAAIVPATRLSIRLDVVETDACRRFHADHVTARLICTLAGRGTQWLDAADAAALARGEAVDKLTIRSIATGDVALFKGRLWSPDAPIVHRSPPIATTGERRLLLVIDPARDDAPVRA